MPAARGAVATAVPASSAAPASAEGLGGLAVAVLGLALAFLVVFVWRIGGVVLVLGAGHGVHSGDLLALPLLLPALGSLRRWLTPA